MTIPYQVLIADGDPGRAAQIVQDVFTLVDTHFNNWNPDSEISQINRQDAGIGYPLSAPLAELLERAKELVTMTDGRFDPTVAPLCDTWKRALNAHRSPSPDAIARVRTCVGWHTLQIQNGTITKLQDGTALDLCGFAKGHAVDLIVERLNAAGYLDVYVTWGGEIRASGRHPSGRAWNAAVASPTGGHPLATVPLTNCAVATSGDYEQVWVTDDACAYTHICNPSTGYALHIHAASIASATVVAPSCLLADGLATALMLAQNAQEAEQLIAQWEAALPDVSILVAVCDSVW